MKNKPRKGLQDIRTRSSLTNETQNPQRKFLRVASLELKKSLCEKVRDTARRRAGEMDEKIAELDAELDCLLGGRQRRRAEGVQADDTLCLADDQQQGQCGFTLKY